MVSFYALPLKYILFALLVLVIASLILLFFMFLFHVCRLWFRSRRRNMPYRLLNKLPTKRFVKGMFVTLLLKNVFFIFNILNYWFIYWVLTELIYVVFFHYKFLTFLFDKHFVCVCVMHNIIFHLIYKLLFFLYF